MIKQWLRLACLTLILSGCTTAQRSRLQRQYDRLPWRDSGEQAPVVPDTPDVPAAPDVPVVPDAPVPPPVVERSVMQFFERDGRMIVRLAAHLQPRGYSLITAHGHKHIDPVEPGDAVWMAANNARPPTRYVDGYAEWVLPWSRTELTARTLSFRAGSGNIIMVFHKLSPSGDISHFVRTDRDYGTGINTPVRNITNQEWRQVR